MADTGEFEKEELDHLGLLSQEDFEATSDRETAKKYRVLIQELVALRRDIQSTSELVSELKIAEELTRELVLQMISEAREKQSRSHVNKVEDKMSDVAEDRRIRIQEPIHLGRGVSSRLKFEGGDALRSSSLGLPELSTFVDLARAFSQTPAHLQWLTYQRDGDGTDHYTRFAIPKRKEGTRLISSPKPAMRAAQEWIRQEILSHLPVNQAAMAFVPGRSIVENAHRHANSEVIIRIDLKDFFPSITFGRVRQFFGSLGYNPGISTVLALICTDVPRAQASGTEAEPQSKVTKRSLPQGACTSPDLANLIASRIDSRLMGLADKHGWIYTRYADDLVFSHKEKFQKSEKIVWVVTKIVNEEGFLVNEEKTRIMNSPARQIVTGLIVNDGVRLTRKDLRKMRAFFHRCETQGFARVSAEIGKDAQAVARGYYSYVHMVTPAVARAMREKHSWI